jgi:hypothetical protein
MTIEEIYSVEDITVRSLNVCKHNDLKDLHAILKHYNKFRTFENIRNCGSKSNKELIELCLKYIEIENLTENQMLLKSIILDLPRSHIDLIDNFIEIHFNNLSNRTKNALTNFLKGNFKLRNISERILTNATFNANKIQNIGSKSIIEINKFIDSIKGFIKNVSSAELYLPRSHRDTINNFIEIHINNLSNRSKNALIISLKGNFEISNINEKILTNATFNINKIQNIGSKSIIEINKFIDSIKGLIKNVPSAENEIALRNKIYFEKTFEISEIPNEVIESQSIFTLTDFLIKQNVIFHKNQNTIFRKTIKIYNGQVELIIDEIAKEQNLSRERVRQKRKNCLDELSNKLQFVKRIDDDLYQKYGIDLNQNYLFIEEDLNRTINEINNTNFSNEFISFLIYVYSSDRFELVGAIEDVLVTKQFNSRERHNWSNLYLVRNHLTNLFDFNNFGNDMARRINDKIEETYTFHFKSYLNNFIKIKDSTIISEVFPIAERIINQEFNLIIDINDNIVFKRNTIKQVSEYVIEALEKLGLPSKIEDIYKLIEKDYTKNTKSQEALRSSMQRTSDIIYFGRSGTYGLKKWELEKEGVKGGSLKDIIISFLDKKKQPIHISLILEYLKKFRGNKNERSVITNLKVDPDKRFIFYSQSFIGLKKNLEFYSEKYNRIPVHLGKIVIGKYHRGYTKSEINIFLQTNYDLTIDESNLIINNLKYFNEN